MADNTNLITAAELAAKNKVHFPNESPEYRQARNDLLSAEIELRRHVERVAALRRALPSGGEIPEDYGFESANGAVRLSQLFGDKDTLVIYSMMFGPQRERACPMCTAMLTSWEGTARNLRERVARAERPAHDGEVPGLNIFTRSDGRVRHFWSGEMSGEMADPGQDPRGAPDVDLLWTILDLTPAGRGTTWYPKLEYASLTTIK